MSALQTPFRLDPPATEPPRPSSLAFPPFRQGLVEDPARPSAAVLAERSCGDIEPVRQLIRERFDQAYGARIAHFMPRLFSLHQVEERPLGAVGLREAQRQALFLERYLDQPIEVAIGARVGRSVQRSEIVEVGQFAGTGAGAFRNLILRLTEQLHREGHRWVVFTGTTALRNAFARLGLTPVELAEADPLRLDESERADWGSYYSHGPRVMFGDIREGHAAMAARRGMKA